MKNIQINIFPNKYGKMFCMFIFLCFISFFVKAQDKIHKTDSTVIEAKVLEINNTEIKYKKFSNQNGPTYTISKNEVQMIVYENGEKEIFNAGNTGTVKPVEIVKNDSVQFIEGLWGVKFENTQENDGGVKIIKLESNSIFKQGIPLGFGRALLTDKITICYVNNGGKPVRVKNTSELARVLFESYNQGISKINLVPERGAKLSYFTNDHLGIDITGISKCLGADTVNKKLGIKESKKAGGIVAGIYRKGQNWAMQGFCSGLMFGVAGIGLVSVIAVTSPAKKYLPAAPPNVDAKAWSRGYRAKIKKKRLVSGILGSLVGSAIVIGAFSSK